MADLVVIVPSRGRPEAAKELVEAFGKTSTAETQLVFAIDETDPTGPEYPGPDLFAAVPQWVGNCKVECPSHSMGQALQRAVRLVVDPFDEARPPFAIAFMGDDHRPRTFGWDQAYLDALHELGTGIVYGNDLLQGERLPTQVAMTSDIVRTLGWMAPPTLTHLYFDNFWLDLGTAADCIRYLPDVVVEHCHPIAGKAEWDEGYRRVNNSAMYERDSAAYALYRRTSFGVDVAKVRMLRREQAIARGAKVADANRILVGEAGPEVFVTPTNGYITPNDGGA